MNSKRRKVWIILVLVLIASAFLIINYSPAESDCPTDLNGDRVTDSLDLNILKEAYGKEITASDTAINADLNRNNIINAEDLSIMMGSINKPCE
jgi:hypothetical protein